MHADNAAELLALPDVDGALVGGASLDAEEFAAIVAAAKLMETGTDAVPLPGGAAAPPAPSCVLVVLDGWGLAAAGPGNAVSLARTPMFDELWDRYPHTTLTASGLAVGLPEGQMGNSEVGHMNLGAGAVIMQDLTRIDLAVADGALAANAVLRAAFTDVPAGGRVHLIGLVSDGGVHSSIEHLRALIMLGKELEVEDLVIHAFTDGRDTLPQAGEGFLDLVERGLAGAGVGRVGSVIGRYYAMDRDKRWDRIKLAYDLLVHGTAEHHAETAVQAMRDAYARGETDEFVMPTAIGAEARIRPGDSVIAFNFRPDRMRELTRALADRGVQGGRSWRWPGGRALHDDDRVRGGLALSGRVPAGASGGHAAAGDRRPWRAPAARRRDREVPARDVLLRGRRGDTAGGGAPRGGALAAGRADLRLQAADERAGGCRRVCVGLAGGPAHVRDHQLRQRRHGRSHGRDPGRRVRDRDRRPLPRARWSAPCTRAVARC